MTESEKLGRKIAPRIKGEVLFDDLSRTLYSTAACIYSIKPLGVVLPHDVEDLQEVVGIAKEEGISMTARGVGSSLSGQAIGPGLIVDFSRHMNRLIEIDVDRALAHVQPGLICGSLNNALSAHNLFFPPDPSTSDYCTLGGMLGNNSSGAHSVKYGNTIDYVESVDVVLSDGRLMTFAREDAERGHRSRRGDQASDDLIRSELRNLIETSAQVIEANFPDIPKNCSGYPLDRVFKDGSFNLAKLFIGSEGTLGFITRAVLRVVDRPGAKALALFYFDGLEKAGEAVIRTLEMGPSMVEIMDRRCLDKSREARPDLERFLPRDAHAELLVEFDGPDSAEAEAAMDRLSAILCKGGGPAFGVARAEDDEERLTLMEVRKAMLPLLNRIRGPKRVTSFIEDAAIPPQLLAGYIKDLYKIIDVHGVEAVLFGHAGQGNLHVRPLLDLRDETDIQLMRSISREVHDLVISMGGTVSGEHGDGMSRSEFLPKQFGPAYPLMQKVKQVLDPAGLMNPGKIIGAPEGNLCRNLRYGADYSADGTETLLHFEPGRFQEEVEACHGCAACKRPINDLNMCPLFKANPVEKAAPRAKANFLRHVISGRLPVEALHSPQAREMLELCINCKSCAVDCPSLVNIPRLWDEARARYHAVKGRSLGEKMLGDVESAARAGSRAAPLSNLIAPLLGRTVGGVAPQRRLPPFRRRPFLSRHAGRRYGSGRIKAALFIDSYVNYYAPEVAEEFMDLVLEGDVALFVPEQTGCGMPQLNNGGLDEARKAASFNIKSLGEAVREGYRIVSLEPTATLCLREEYKHILSPETVQPVSDQVEDASLFLLRLYEQGSLTAPFQPLDLTVGHHTPCHLRVLGAERPALNLLKLIPGLKVVDIREGCCGMAGTFGFKKKWYSTSMAIGEGLFQRLKSPEIDFGVSDCSSCRMQMEHGSGKEALHPIRLLLRARKE